MKKLKPIIQSNILQWVFGVLCVILSIFNLTQKPLSFGLILGAVIFIICSLLTIRMSRLALYSFFGVKTLKKNKMVKHNTNIIIAIILIFFFIALSILGLNIRDTIISKNKMRDFCAKGYCGIISDPPVPFPFTTKYAIAIACRDHVNQELASFSTKDFQNIFVESRRVTDIGDNMYELYSFFDSQNSSGTTIRKKFDCIMKYIGGDTSDKNSYYLMFVDEA